MKKGGDLAAPSTDHQVFFATADPLVTPFSGLRLTPLTLKKDGSGHTETQKKAAAGEMPSHGRGWRTEVGAENLSQLQLLGIGPRTGATTVAAEDSSQFGSTKAVGQPGLRAGRTQ